MKILIAGGMGYIGSALIELYRSRTDLDIIVLDKKFIPERVANFPQHIRFVQGEIQDATLMKSLLKEVDVLHMLAAEVQAESSIHRERSVWEQNFEYPKALFELCPTSTRIMFPSTGNVFGGVDENEKYMDLNEEDLPKPKYPYAETKVAVEKYLKDSGKQYTILRFGTNHGYAPGIRFNLVTNIFTLRSIQGDPLTVHGGGENYRPTVCVKDCAKALDFLSERNDTNGEIFHVVCENFKIHQLAEKVSHYAGSTAPIQHVAKVVPFSAYALSNQKIKKWGFQFEWNLEKSVKEMAQIFKSRFVELGQ